MAAAVAGMYLLRRYARAGLVYNRHVESPAPIRLPWNRRGQSFLPTILEPPGHRWASPEVNDTWSPMLGSDFLAMRSRSRIGRRPPLGDVLDPKRGVTGTEEPETTLAADDSHRHAYQQPNRVGSPLPERCSAPQRRRSGRRTGDGAASRGSLSATPASPPTPAGGAATRRRPGGAVWAAASVHASAPPRSQLRSTQGRLRSCRIRRPEDLPFGQSARR
jgi:hypothetical protein